jgi:hypothetical protein
MQQTITKIFTVPKIIKKTGIIQKYYLAFLIAQYYGWSVSHSMTEIKEY